MKQATTQKFRYLIRITILILCLFQMQSFSQNPPAVEWTSVSWADEDVYDNYQSQVNSGEDWWYDHENVYNGSVQTGYFTVGYSSLILRSEADFTQAQLVFNEGNDSPRNPINHDVKPTYINYDFTNMSYPNPQHGCGDRIRPVNIELELEGVWL